MKTVLLTLLISGFYPYLARADTDIFPNNCSVPAPDITNFEVVSKSRIEFRLSEEVVAYLGLDVEQTKYRDPDDSGRFVQVISRHRPRVFAKPELSSERLFAEVAAAFYADKDEQDLLAALEKELDPLIYIYWRVTKDPRTLKDVKDGDFDIWFLMSDGTCKFFRNEKLRVQFLSENVGNGKPHNVFVGVKYQVGNVYHILKVNRSDVNALTRERR